MEPMKPEAAPSIDGADALLWLRLFHRLDATLLHVETPEAVRVFRALGPRRKANAHQRLLRERQRVLCELEAIGVCPLGAGGGPPVEAQRAPGIDSIHWKLADAFEQCAPSAQKMGKAALNKWVLERARMHRLHALFLSE